MDRRMGEEDIFREAVENLATIIDAAELPANERLKSALQDMSLHGRPYIERESHDEVLKTALDHAYTLFRNGVKDGTQYTMVRKAWGSHCCSGAPLSRLKWEVPLGSPVAAAHMHGLA